MQRARVSTQPRLRGLAHRASTPRRARVRDEPGPLAEPHICIAERAACAPGGACCHAAAPPHARPSRAGHCPPRHASLHTSPLTLSASPAAPSRPYTPRPKRPATTRRPPHRRRGRRPPPCRTPRTRTGTPRRRRTPRVERAPRFLRRHPPWHAAAGAGRHAHAHARASAGESGGQRPASSALHN